MTNIVETIARAMWDDRERTFPPSTRMKWEAGTDEARSLTLGCVSAVFRALEANGYAIVPCELSEAMWDAAMREGYDQDPSTYYRAMISTGKAKA